ncbi:MAG: ribosome small subunit-dependent GTPase A [Pseudomonadota bacterium]
MTLKAETPVMRVIQSFGGHGWAVDETRRHLNDTSVPIPIHYRRTIGRCLPGDHVRLDKDQAVQDIEPRRNCFGRGKANGDYQPIAANLDSLWIVIAPEPAPSAELVHRYIAAARIQSIEPRIVVNKCDLPWPDQAPFNQLDQFGLDVVQVQCEPKSELDALMPWLQTGVHVLAGQSGVGKSTISNALIPTLDLHTQALSNTTGKGRHTTTTATLHPLSGQGWLVDTPGVWEYSLWSMPIETLELGFPEFLPLKNQCRFRNCRHEHEPGCAVLKAVQQGELPAFRHHAWLQLLAEQARLTPSTSKP